MLSMRSSVLLAVVCSAILGVMVSPCISVTHAEPLTAQPDYLYVCVDETKEVAVSGGSFSAECIVRSADSDIATAEMNGMTKKIEVTGVSTGETTINVTDSDDNSVEIRVKVFPIYMSS